MLDIKYGLHMHTTAHEYPVAISANATATDIVSGIFVHEDPSADGVILATAANVTNGDSLSVVWDGYNASPGSDTVTVIKGRFLAWVDASSLKITTDIDTDFVKGAHLTIDGATGKLVTVAAATDPFVAIVRGKESDKLFIEVLGFSAKG